jgi:hypothetical protein
VVAVGARCTDLLSRGLRPILIQFEAQEELHTCEADADSLRKLFQLSHNPIEAFVSNLTSQNRLAAQVSAGELAEESAELEPLIHLHPSPALQQVAELANQTGMHRNPDAGFRSC